MVHRGGNTGGNAPRELVTEAAMAEGVRISIEEGVGTITLARPERLNAFDEETIAKVWSGNFLRVLRAVGR